MTAPRIEREPGKLQIVPGQKHWYVTIECMNLQMWLPFMSANEIGVYLTLRCFAKGQPNNRVYGKGIRYLAELSNVAIHTFRDITNKLCECGWLSVEKPIVDKMKMGHTINYFVHDIPAEISEALISKLTDGHPETYKCPSPHLYDDSKYRTSEDEPEETLDTVVEEVPQMTQGVSQTTQGVSQTTDKSFVLNLSSSIEIQSQFPEPEIRDTSASPSQTNPAAQVSSKSAVTNASSQTALVTEKSTRAGTSKSVRANASPGHTPFTGKAILSAEERLLNDDPPIFKLLFRSLHAADARCDKTLSANQIADLVTVPVCNFAGEVMNFTLAELYRDHHDDFDDWVMGLPATLTRHGRTQKTPGNMIRYMRSYDDNGTGFVDFLKRRGNHDLQVTPKHEVTADEMAKAFAPSAYTQEERIYEVGEEIE